MLKPMKTFVLNLAKFFINNVKRKDNSGWEGKMIIVIQSTLLYWDTLVQSDFVRIKQRNGLVRIIRRYFAGWFCSDLSIFIWI